VFQRKDTRGWYASFVDSSGVRRKMRVQGHTRAQALEALALLKVQAECERLLGVKGISEICTADLFKRYGRYQKAHVAVTTSERLESIFAR